MIRLFGISTLCVPEPWVNLHAVIRTWKHLRAAPPLNQLFLRSSYVIFCISFHRNVLLCKNTATCKLSGCIHIRKKQNSYRNIVSIEIWIDTVLNLIVSRNVWQERCVSFRHVIMWNQITSRSHNMRLIFLSLALLLLDFPKQMNVDDYYNC